MIGPFGFQTRCNFRLNPASAGLRVHERFRQDSSKEARTTQNVLEEHHRIPFDSDVVSLNAFFPFCLVPMVAAEPSFSDVARANYTGLIASLPQEENAISRRNAAADACAPLISPPVAVFQGINNTSQPPRSISAHVLWIPSQKVCIHIVAFLGAT